MYELMYDFPLNINVCAREESSRRREVEPWLLDW